MVYLATDRSQSCKRVTVILCGLIHFMLTLYVLHVVLGSTLDCYRNLNPHRSQTVHLTKLQQANRKAAIEFRRRATPLVLMLRLKDIEAEMAMDIQQQVPEAEKTEEEEIEELTELEESVHAAVVDDAIGALQRRLLPPEKCHSEPNTDFGGIAVRWGLTFHVSTVAECCNGCSKQDSCARGSQLKCNVWVYCPRRSGCPSPDGYEHRFGECWLKQADKPIAIVNHYSSGVGNESGTSLPVFWTRGGNPLIIGRVVRHNKSI